MKPPLFLGRSLRRNANKRAFAGGGCGPRGSSSRFPCPFFKRKGERTAHAENGGRPSYSSLNGHES